MAHIGHVCGCYVWSPQHYQRRYLPQVELKSHTTILSAVSTTVLTQKYVNPAKNDPIDELRYTFPLYEGVSVVEFTCHIGQRTIKGLVRERDEAKQIYKEAVDRGETAGLLEQLPAASDVFTTTIGNVPAGATVEMIIRYNGELKHDAELDALRFTIPTTIAPRYGSYPGEIMETNAVRSGFAITVDASMTGAIQRIQSPSHPIAVSVGTLSTAPSDNPELTKGSATLTLGTTELEKDFVLQIVSKDFSTPQALLETHPTIPGQRALMTTLVPKFSLKPQQPEIIFIADRSGSMIGNIDTLRAALRVFLKSLPVGVKFNICSFGSDHEFLWKKSQAYSMTSLEEAMNYVSKFAADFGGTETFAAVEAAVNSRYTDLSTEIMLLTDGDIWNQDGLFAYLNETISTSKGAIRVFPLGIGDGVSSALIEGVARAGNGFAQMVGNGERMDTKVVRMLKAALTPHITDYALEVTYKNADANTNADEDFEIIDKVVDGLKLNLNLEEQNSDMASTTKETKEPISLYDPNATDDAMEVDSINNQPQNQNRNRFANLPELPPPKLLQTPARIPALFPFSRTNVYLLMSPATAHLQPLSVTLRATCEQGPLELTIPIRTLDAPGETIHQLAAKKTCQELEEGRGWIAEATDADGVSLKKKYPSKFNDMVEREAVRLGVQYQVGGKWTSFVAVEANGNGESVQSERRRIAEETSSPPAPGGSRGTSFGMGLGGRRYLRDNSAPAAAQMSSSTPPLYRFHEASVSNSRSGGLASRPPSTLMGMSPPPALMGSMSPPPAPMGMSRGGPSPSGTRGPSGKKWASLNLRAMGASAISADRRLVTKPTDSVRGGAKQDSTLDRGPSPETPTGPVDLSGPALLHHLIDAQTFEGSWALDALPCDAMRLDRAAAMKALEVLREKGMVKREEEALATALVVVFLEKCMGGEKEAWELVVEKARGWLAGLKGGMGDGALEVAGGLVGHE